MPLPDHLEALRSRASTALDAGTADYIAALEKTITDEPGPDERIPLSKVRDVSYFQRHKDAILRAAREGRLDDDVSVR